MVVGFTKPHLPFSAPQKYWNLYKRENFKVPAKFSPNNMYRLALTNWGELRAYDGMPQDGYLSDFQPCELTHGYSATVSYMDAQIGKVMKSLDELNLRKNTIVVLMGDHGWKLGEYGAWCKHSNFELDVRVPMIVSRQTGYDKRFTNATFGALVENVDLFQTIADTCGFETAGLYGQSLLPLVDNPKKKGDDAAYSLFFKRKKHNGFYMY